VVAGENHDEDGAGSVVGEGVRFAVNAREREIRRRGTEGEDRMRRLRGKEQRKNE